MQQNTEMIIEKLGITCLVLKYPCPFTTIVGPPTLLDKLLYFCINKCASKMFVWSFHYAWGFPFFFCKIIEKKENNNKDEIN